MLLVPSGGQCSRLQLPLKLAWAVTIHKPQGITLNKVVINVGKKEFSQASHLWPALQFVSSKAVHMHQRCVCLHVGLGVVGYGCGFMSLIIRYLYHESYNLIEVLIRPLMVQSHWSCIYYNSEVHL